MNENQVYYNFYNMQDIFQQLGLTSSPQLLKWFKELIAIAPKMFSYKFKDKNIKTPSSWVIEMALLFTNGLCFYYHKALNELVLCRYLPLSTFDIYYLPKKVNLIALNGEPLAYDVPYEDIVVLRDNSLDIPPIVTMNDYIKRIITLENTLDMNAMLLRLPVMFYGDKNQVGSIKKLFQKISNFEPFAIADKRLAGTENVVQQDIKFPQSLKETYDLMESYKNACANSIGIYSSKDKQERLLVGEVQATNDYVDFQYQSRKQSREESLKELLRKNNIECELEELYINIRKDTTDMQANDIYKTTKAQEKAKASEEGKGDKNEQSRTDV